MAKKSALNLLKNDITYLQPTGGPQEGVQPPSLPGAQGVGPPALDLPPVPHTSLPGSNSGGSGGGGDVDFDDLTRRFEELKKRK